MILASARWLAPSLVLPMCLLAACDRAPVRREVARISVSPAPSQPSAPSGPASAPDPYHDPPDSASERYALDMVRNACKARDYRTFFDSFARSAAVRQTYSADTIEFANLGRDGQASGLKAVDRAAYQDFPVLTQDYTYRPRKPPRPGDDGEYLYLQFNQIQNNDLSVEWTRIHYVGEPQGEEPGSPVDLSGNPIAPGDTPRADGQLLFRATAACWELAADYRRDWSR